jgi:hypothetical protein
MVFRGTAVLVVVLLRSWCDVRFTAGPLNPFYVVRLTLTKFGLHSGSTKFDIYNE